MSDGNPFNTGLPPSSPRPSTARPASRGHTRNVSYGSGRHNLASRAGSDVNSTAGSVWSDHTDGTENTYLREFKPSFSSYSQYIFTVLAAVISAKEIWRFPYTVMGHDSGVFVLLYLIMTLSVGIPLVYLELIIGVRFRVGAIKCFNAMGERATGIGVSQLVLSFLILVYQPLIMAWSLYFIFVSFGTMTTILPWSTCPVINGTMSTCCIQDSSTYYWFERVLNVSTGLADPEPTHQTHLAVCYVVTWFIAYLCILRGVRISAMISYVTVTIPLIILLIIFVRVLFLDGALIGLVTFITPNLGAMNRISVPLMLLDLMSQTLNTCGVAIGLLMTFKARSRDPGYPTFEAFLIGFLNMTVSVVSALILYAIIGHLMVTKKRTKQEVFVSRGASVVFSVFPNIFSYFLVPNVWSILFFVALVLISIDSMYCQVNAITLSLMEVGGFRYIPYSILSLIITLTCALSGLPFLMGNGVYLFEAMDGTINPVICMAALLECTYISWFYGLDRLDEELEERSGLTMNDCWKWLIKWYIPAVLFLILVTSAGVSLIEHPNYRKYVGCEGVGYKGLTGTKSWFKKTFLSYPEFGIKVLIFVISFLPVPLFVWYFWPISDDELQLDEGSHIPEKSDYGSTAAR